MKPKFAPRAQCEANGQAAFSLMVCLLEVLARKETLLTEGEMTLIIENAHRRLPSSPHQIDELARDLVASLRGQFRRPMKTNDPFF